MTILGTVHLANYLVSDMLLQIICGMLAGGVVYLGGAYIFRFNELNEVKYMLNRKR